MRKYIVASLGLILATSAAFAGSYSITISPALPSVTAQRTQNFIDSIGVNTHIYQGGVYSTSNIISDMSYLGINSVRDYPMQFFSQTTNFTTVAAAGIQFDMDFAGGSCSYGNTSSQAASYNSGWDTLVASYPGAIQFIEGMNEINNQPVCWQEQPTTNASTASGNAVLHFAAVPSALLTMVNAGYASNIAVTGTGIAGSSTTVSATSTTVTLNNNTTGVANGATITLQSSNTNPAAGIGWQSAIYSTVHGDANLNGIGVLNFTDSPNYGVTGTADYNNQHLYPTFGVQPDYQLTPYSQYLTITGLPLVVTEFGYYTAANLTPSGVDQTTQARFILNGLLSFFNNGIAKTYIYELADEGCDSSPPSDSEKHYGLFDCSSAAKTSATTIHNLTTILADTGGTARTFTTSPLSYVASGMPAPGTYGGADAGSFQYLMQKSNGNWYIPVVWDTTSWYWAGSPQEQSPPNQTVTLQFGTTFSTINVYQPDSSTTPIATSSNANSVSLTLNADALIVELIP